MRQQSDDVHIRFESLKTKDEWDYERKENNREIPCDRGHFDLGTRRHGEFFDDDASQRN
jgi:hypothetical protein